MKKTLASLFIVISFLTWSQSEFQVSTQEIKNGKYFFINQKSGIGDCDETSYYKLHPIKAEVTEVKKIGGYVHSFNLYQVNAFRHNDNWVWENEENPIAFNKGEQKSRVVLYPYKGTIYLLTKPFYVDVTESLSTRWGGENAEVCITGWIQKKKPKTTDVNSYKRHVVQCPVTIEELRADAQWNLQKRKDIDAIKFPAVISILDQEVKSYALKTKWTLSRGHSVFWKLKVGVEAELKNGKKIYTNNFGGGLGVFTDFEVEVDGGCLEHTKYIESKGSVHQAYRFDLTSRDEKHHLNEDYVDVIVKNKRTGETIVNKKVPFDYSVDIDLDYSNPDGSFCYDGWDAGDVKVRVDEGVHSENETSLLLYTINVNNFYEENQNFYLKLSPDSKLSIYNDAGNGGDCNSSNERKGGLAREIVLENNTSSDLLNLKLVSRNGREGDYALPPADYEPQKSNDYSSKSESSEITIKNNSGKSICVAHSGGSTSIGNGSSDSFSCRDLYYGIMDGANCTGKFGAKIADEENNCGETITLD